MILVAFKCFMVGFGSGFGWYWKLHQWFDVIYSVASLKESLCQKDPGPLHLGCG